MPIKTAFLKLNKIQENEYYNADIENENLDKIDTIICNHDSRTSAIENKFNKKDQLQINLSSKNQVQSVSNSFGGACDFEIEGKLIKNILDQTLERDSGSHMYNHVIVEPNMPYTIKNTTDMHIHLYYGDKDVLSEPIDHVLPHKTLKFTPIKSKLSLYLIDGVGKTFGETMMVEGNEVPSTYFKGIQPSCGIAIGSTGKNLFDKNNAYDNSMVYLNGKITFIENDKQWVSTNPIDVREGMKLTLPSRMYFFTDVNWKHKLLNTGQLFDLPVSQTITIPEGINGRVIFNINKGGLNVGEMKSLKIQIEEAEIPTDYEAHVSSKVVIEEPLASLPNGVTDKIVRENSKTIKYANTNVGRDGEFYSVKKSDVEIYTTGVNVNLVRVKRSSLKDIATGMVSGIVVNNKSNIERNPSNPWDSIERIGEYSTSISKTFVDFIVNKNIDTLNKAQSYVVDTKLAYQLINPINIELVDELEALMSYDKYTQFSINDGSIEREKVKFYDSGSYHYFNYKTEDSTHSKFAVQSFECILQRHNGEETDITKDCLIEELDIYKDNLGFAILNDDIKKYNLDVNNIYVTYKTSESNNQSKLKLTYNSNLSDTISSNSTSINRLGDQIDYLTNIIDAVVEFSPLLQNKAKEMSIYKHRVSIEKNRLYMEGKIETSEVVSAATIMNIGKAYAPKTDVSFIVSTNALDITASIQITTSGDVKLFYKGGSPKEVTLNQIVYGIGDLYA